MKGSIKPSLTTLKRYEVNQKIKIEELQKAMISSISKPFRDPLKIAVKKDQRYVITKANKEQTKFGDVLFIDAIPVSGGEIIETFFTDLITKRVLKFCEKSGEKCEDLVPGIQFTYRGEITSSAGNTYSNVEFAIDDNKDKDETTMM